MDGITLSSRPSAGFGQWEARAGGNTTGKTGWGISPLLPFCLDSEVLAVVFAPLQPRLCPTGGLSITMTSNCHEGTTALFLPHWDLGILKLPTLVVLGALCSLLLFKC